MPAAAQPHHQAEEGSLGILEVAYLEEVVAYQAACPVESQRSLVVEKEGHHWRLVKEAHDHEVWEVVARSPMR